MTRRKTVQQTQFPDAPEHLSVRSKQIYDSNVGMAIRAPGRIALFVSGLEFLDLADESLKVLNEDGLAPKSERSKLRRAHPCFKTYKESQSQFVKIFKMLGLECNMYNDPSKGWTEII